MIDTGSSNVFLNETENEEYVNTDDRYRVIERIFK